jgi:WD repeat-containing protein 61
MLADVFILFPFYSCNPLTCVYPVQADEKLKKDKFVLSVAFSPDGRRLACGVMDGTVAIFDVPSGQLLHTLTGHHKPVRDVCFTPGVASVHAAPKL